jgi:hypothetical protein
VTLAYYLVLLGAIVTVSTGFKVQKIILVELSL